MQKRGTVLVHCTSPHRDLSTRKGSSWYSSCVMLWTEYSWILSKTTGPTETKFHVASPWYRGKDRKLIQMIKVICCYSSLSSPGSGVFSRDFSTNSAPQCRAFSRAPFLPKEYLLRTYLKIEKLKAPLFDRKWLMHKIIYLCCFSVHVPITTEGLKSVDTVSSQSLHVHNIMQMHKSHVHRIYIACVRKVEFIRRLQ